MKVIVGAGGTSEPGWLALGESDLDVTSFEQWAQRFAPSSLDAILAEHVWEHLTEVEALEATRNAAYFLRPGGVLRIAVPDGLHTCPRYVDWVAPGTGFNGDDHKQLFDYRSLAALMRAAGLRPKLREWWDEAGMFHSDYSRDEEGRIERSLNGKKFFDLTMLLGTPYTSLIVDGVK